MAEAVRVLDGRYELVERLGDGGFASVWRAHDKRMRREVAVKVLHLDAPDRERFEREATAVAQLNHPNVVIAHDFGIDATDNTAYLVLELVTGRSLDQELAAARSDGGMGLALDDVLDIADQVLSGLAAAHAAHVVHRDLKPQNLMRTPTGAIKIVDFGIAHVAEMSRVTSSGWILGTLPYTPPEQLDGTDLDGRADLYALGCVLHELLTGRSAFTATSNASWMRAHYMQVPAHASDRIPDIPAEVDTFIDGLLAKSRDDRPADADAARRQLVRLRAQPAAGTSAALAIAPWQRSAASDTDPVIDLDLDRHDAAAVSPWMRPRYADQSNADLVRMLATRLPRPPVPDEENYADSLTSRAAVPGAASFVWSGRDALRNPSAPAPSRGPLPAQATIFGIMMTVLVVVIVVIAIVSQ